MLSGTVNKSDITPIIVRELLDYDPRTGRLTWLRRPRQMFKTEGEFIRWNNRYANTAATYSHPQGYQRLMILRKSFAAHRVAWAIHYGIWPTNNIDHVNGNRRDNRIVNLRDVSAIENAKNQRIRSNNKSGVLGVSSFGEKWRATICDAGKLIHLGVFATIEEAAKARAAANEVYNFHSNHGRSFKDTAICNRSRDAWCAENGVTLRDPSRSPASTTTDSAGYMLSAGDT